MKLYETKSASYTPALHGLANGVLRHNVHSSCYVNGVKFIATERDGGHVTQNNGVMAESVDGSVFSFYGELQSVIELVYGNDVKVVLFKCKWYNTDSLRRKVRRPTTDIDRYGLLSIDTKTSWYEDEPYILATSAKQVFYIDDPSKGKGWKIVHHVSQRGIWSSATLGEAVNDEESSGGRLPQPLEPYQEERASNIGGVEDIRALNRHTLVVAGEFTDITSQQVNFDDDDFIDDEEDAIPLEESEPEANDTSDEDYDIS